VNGRKRLLTSGKDPDHKPMMELLDQKRRMLTEEILSMFEKYIHTIRDARGIINMSIFIATGLGIVKSQSWNIGMQYRGYIIL